MNREEMTSEEKSRAEMSFKEMPFKEKKAALLSCMDRLTCQDTAVAFSGGVDSALILRITAEAAARNGTSVYAVTAATELHPSRDEEISRQTAEQIRNQLITEYGSRVRLEHQVLHLDEFVNADVTENPVDRCYRCKKYIFTTIVEAMREKKISLILEGTNQDDTKVYRPGIRALGELGICSPLMECGFTKAEVRQLAAEYGIAVAERPSTPCMATRFPYGTHLTAEKLRRVEEAENYLRSFGFYNIRLRVHDDIARIETDIDSMPLFLDKRQEIVTTLKGMGYHYITLDLEGFRSGSMDEGKK